MAKPKNNTVQGQLFKKPPLPKMPEGYYSGDKPNPNLRSFVEGYLKEHPYDPATDDYDVAAFNKPIEATGATAIYNMHSYHQGKKPHDAIRQYIRHFTKPGDLVLDPFSGSGGTALAALMEGRKAIAIDRSPAATFITKNYCTPVDIEELQRAFDELKAKLKAEMDWLYETRCDRCGGKATTAFVVYSQVFQCPRCMEKIPLFDCVEVKSETAAGKPKKMSVCPHCYKKGREEEISTRAEKFGPMPVLVSYLCENGCKPKRGERRHNDLSKKKRQCFEKYDLGKLQEIEAKDIPHWVPTHKMMNVADDSKPWGAEWREGRNFRTVTELFTKRNLWASAAIRRFADEVPDASCRDLALAALTGSLFHLSRMSQHKEGGGGIMVGTYYTPQMFKERNALANLSDKFAQIVQAKESESTSLRGPAVVSTQSACDMSSIPAMSVDYIFTDPPYGDKVQYGELNFVWEAWLGFDTHWHGDEIIVNAVRGTTEADWARLMRQAMGECSRILKPGRWLSLCYHDTSEGTWALVQDIMAEVGFVTDKTDGALFIDKHQKSYNQYTADKVTKRDLVVNFRKPKPDEVAAAVTITGKEDKRTFNQKVHLVIREFLAAHPGAAKDRIYDDVVSRMVRKGQMEAHNFDELLRQVADEVKQPVRKNLLENEDPNLFGTHEIGRWYLKETADEADAAETDREDAAAESLTRFIKKAKKDYEEGVHYSDLFEHFIYSIKDKPRRQLADWLPDYFYKTETGTWRLPASEEEEQIKAQGRQSGLTRKIKRYITCIEAGLPVSSLPSTPSNSDLAEWTRHCKRAGLYEQGKLLYERGGLNVDQLPEEAQVNVEEDYQVCVRMLSREAAAKPAKGKRGRKSAQVELDI